MKRLVSIIFLYIAFGYSEKPAPKTADIDAFWE